VTAIGFLPWCLAVPWALWRRLRGPWRTPEDRAWLLLAIWPRESLAVFTLSPFKLPHYGLPAFPALALPGRKLWDEVLEGAPGAPSPRTLLAQPLLLFAAPPAPRSLAWRGYLTLPAGALPSADVARAKRRRPRPGPSFHVGRAAGAALPLADRRVRPGALAAAAGLALRRPTLGLGALLAAMLAFLPFAAEGFELFARSRSVRMLGDAVALWAAPGDLLAHEGALENSGSWLLTLDPPGRAPAAAPVKVVNGLRLQPRLRRQLPEARIPSGTRTDWPRPGETTGESSSSRPPARERSVTRTLPPDSCTCSWRLGGRRLYSNRP
jgi:4-amino-4-deoxy-L-arabinose transferase-like glycosyltransferase